MATLTDILNSPLFQTGVNLFNTYQQGQNTKGAIDQANTGFNNAIGTITDFGNKSLNAIQTGADQAKQSLTDFSTKAQSYQQPFYDSGLAALSQYQSLLNNPSQVMTDPGVQFQYNQGLEALNRQLENNNLLNSSARLNAAQQYGQGFASTALDNALSRQNTLVNMGQTAGNNLSTINQNTGVSLANLAQNTGQNIANVNQGMGNSLSQLELGRTENLAGKNVINARTGTDYLGALTSPTGVAAIGSVADGIKGILNGSTSGLSQSIAGLFGSGATSGAVAYPVAPNPSVTATPLPAGTELPPPSTNPAVMNAANIGLGALGASKFIQSGASNDAGKAGSAIGAAAGSLVPIMGPVTAAAGSILGGTIGNMAGSLYNNITGRSDSDWAIRYDSTGSGMTGKGSFTTPLGTFGFSARQTRNMGENDKAQIVNGLKDAFTQMDTTIATALTPDELSAVKSAMNGFEVGQGSNATKAEYSANPMLGMTKKRLEALKATLSPERLRETGLDQVINQYNSQFKEPPSIQEGKLILRDILNGKDLSQYDPSLIDKIKTGLNNLTQEDLSQPGAQLTVIADILAKMKDNLVYRV